MKIIEIQDKILKKFSSKEFIASVYRRANFKVTYNPRNEKGFQPDLMMEYQPTSKKLKKRDPKKLIFIISEIDEFPYTYSRSKIVDKFEVFYVFRYQNNFFKIPSKQMKLEFNEEKEFLDIARPLFDSEKLKKFRDEQADKLKKKKLSSKVKDKVGKLKSMIKGKKQNN